MLFVAVVGEEVLDCCLLVVVVVAVVGLVVAEAGGFAVGQPVALGWQWVENCGGRQDLEQAAVVVDIVAGFERNAAGTVVEDELVVGVGVAAVGTAEDAGIR